MKKYFGDYSIELWFIGTASNGKPEYHYEMRTPDGEVLFEGDSFFSYAVKDQLFEDILGFLTLQPDDTDADYFDSYTPIQMKFVKSFDCEALKGFINE